MPCRRHHHRRRRMRPRRAMRPRRPRPSSAVSLLEVPVGCSKSSGARRRAVASFKENIESPAYSRGGDQSAGFYGYGIQQATRLMRVLLKRCERGYRTFRRRCQSPGGDFYRHAGLARRPASPARGRGRFFNWPGEEVNERLCFPLTRKPASYSFRHFRLKNGSNVFNPVQLYWCYPSLCRN